MAMVSLRRPKEDVKKRRERLHPTPWVNPDDQGVRVELEHHHLMALKGSDGQPIAGRLKSQHRVKFSGEGVVERSESRSTENGERHSATLRMHRGEVEHRAPKKEKPTPKKRSRGEPRYPAVAKDYVS